MNSDSSKLRQHQQQSEQAADSQLRAETQSAQEFDSVEELFRADLVQTPPPETIAERLKESIAHEPAPRAPWWRRLFSK